MNAVSELFLYVDCENRLDVEDYLDRKVINTEIRDNHGNTPLIIASRSGYVDIVNLLLDRGADIEGTNNDVRTPLITAIIYWKLEVVKLLLKRGADVERKKKSIMPSPLYFAFENKRIDIIEELLEYGADYFEDKDMFEIMFEYLNIEEIKQVEQILENIRIRGSGIKPVKMV